MEIKNSREIINDFLDRYDFAITYKDGVMPVAPSPQDVRLDRKSAIDFLLAGALTGKKVIGFFSDVPRFRAKYLLRGECIFVTTKLPDRVSSPVIFCRKPEDIAPKLLTALKVSLDSKLPVVLVISDNALDNFAPYERASVDVGRSFAYLGTGSFEASLDRKTFSAAIDLAYNILSEVYPKETFETDKIAFNDPEFEFFDYVLPIKTVPLIKNSKKLTFLVPDYELDDMDIFLDACGITKFTLSPFEVAKKNKHVEFLCPGCPIVAVFNKLREQSSTLVFTDIPCKGIQEAFPIKHISFDTYAGLAASGLNMPTLFIGSAADYKPYYDQLLKTARVIMLDDCGLKDISAYPTIKHPKKINTFKNSLFAYGCSNIKTYSKCSVKVKRCNCTDNGGVCPAMEFTKCPAISIVSGKAFINKETCTGCQVCRDVCKFGAIA